MQIIPYFWLVLLSHFPLLLQRQLVGTTFIIISSIGAVVLLQVPKHSTRYLGWLVLLFNWGQVNGLYSINQLTQLTQRPLTVQVKITEFQRDKQRLKVALVNVEGRAQFPVLSAWISAVETPEFCVGQRWSMRLRLRAVHSQLNQGGYDSQRHALANSTPFRGTMLTQTPLDLACSLADHLDKRYQQLSLSSPWGSISRALLFGLRDQIPTEIAQLFRDTGVAHLMAISGMHIGLMYLIGRQGIRLLQPWLPRSLQASSVATFSGWSASLAYCALSGGQPSALRALSALCLWQLSRIVGVNISSFQVVLGCVAILLMINPLLILSDSLWLSVLAVLSLLLWYRWFPLPPGYRNAKRWYVLQLFHLQLGIFILMLPVQIFFFQGISLSALTTNLLAIPIITLGVLPLSVLMLLPWPATLASLLLAIHDGLFTLMIDVLRWQQGLWLPMGAAEIMALASWGGVVIVRFRLWQRYPINTLSWIIGYLSWRLVSDYSAWRIDMLDVGQGLVVVISQGREAIIYDTGNRWVDSDAGQRILIPWLRHQQLTPQQVIISHQHLDHSGGLASILREWPSLSVRTPYAYPNRQPCHRGEQWHWHRLHFRVLWPIDPITPGQNNDSCVIRVSDGQNHLLLTGDIEKQAEQQIVALEKAGLVTTWLQVAHHGSQTSSSSLWVRKVGGEIALASVSRYNPWRLPSSQVIKRYRAAGYQWIDTALAGQISIRINYDGVAILQMRDQISPRWYHQWFGVKPDYR